MNSLLTNFWMYLLLFCVCGYVFALPLLIWATFKHEANPTLQTVDPDELPLPAVVQQHFDAAHPALEEAGFAPEGTLLLPQNMPNVRCLLRMYVNRAAKQSAMVTSIFGLIGEQGCSHVKYVEFCTRYMDGSEINTSNASTGGGAFPPNPTSQMVHIPWIENVGQLYRIHQLLAAFKPPSAQRVVRLESTYDGNLPVYVAGCMRDELEYARQTGYLRLTSGGDEYRATFKGAYLMTWKQLPPFKSLVMYARRKRAENLLASIGIDGI
jgi:hypothetical protein